MHSIIVGVGNPIMGDDAVGLEIAKRIKGKVDAEIRKAIAGGLELAEMIAGYDLAIIVDAFHGKGIKEIELEDYNETVPNHDMAFPSAYHILSRYIRMPHVRILGIGMKDFRLKEGLSKEVESLIPEAIEKIRRILEEENELVIE